MANKTNEVANAGRCLGCGGLYALIGSRHLCKGSSDMPSHTAVKADGAKKSEADKGLVVSNISLGTSTYRYRDQAKRSAYQREYMRGWRARKKEKRNGESDQRKAVQV